MTTPDIAGLCERLRAALEGVTPGPWTIDPNYSWDDGTNLPTQISLRVNGSGWHKIVDSVSISDHDAAFIALSREAVPALLNTLERQAAEIERLRATLGYYSYADDGGKRARAALTGEDPGTARAG
jgi:hypothetical protein